ncbi:Transporter of the ATP-binding cassette (ABC) [Coemansia erecta]|nr:Transporter of the ATP-binding cassette (ABC) [Coemansia erecta]
MLEQEAPAQCAADGELPADWPSSGELKVDGLVAGYTADAPVLRGLTFSVKHGEKIGVVGRTGAGKSTLSLALLRLIEATSGQVVLDGVDIAQIGLNRLRQSIATIAQDPVLFNGTVRFNLDPFNDYPDELLTDALRRTMLLKTAESDTNSAAAFSSLDDAIMSNGQNLSLGQRQLVALARALVRRSRLVILDEATAAVDFENDSRIQQAIRGPEFKDSTLFCIAHRLRTIIDYDRILVLSDGNIVEFDTPANLIQREGGHFRQLCENSNEFELLQSQAKCGKVPFISS